ncbi:MAG: ribonuclease Z [Gemmatimonadota bacterium]|nr:ribonuclease Z [Candidatus Palauibacterales bacterium]
MRLVTVGTGTVVPDPDRGSACHWIEEGGTLVLLDCGAGALPGLARADLPWGRIDYLVISHFHVDHIGEIPSLIFALRHALAEPRTEPLAIWGPEGTQGLFDALAAAFGTWLLQPGFPVTVREISIGGVYGLGELTLKATKTPHTPESVALRLEGGGVSLGYTGDTGPSDDLAKFFRGVDLLLAECSLPEELVGDNHLSPERLAEIATAAEASRLAVTHVYPQLGRLDVPELLRAAGYEGEITMVTDGLEMIV